MVVDPGGRSQPHISKASEESQLFDAGLGRKLQGPVPWAVLGEAIRKEFQTSNGWLV